jgi:hypothetical protein
VPLSATRAKKLSSNVSTSLTLRNEEFLKLKGRERGGRRSELCAHFLYTFAHVSAVSGKSSVTLRSYSVLLCRSPSHVLQVCSVI